MRVDRVALIRGMLVAASRERERRQAAAQAETEASLEKLLCELARMGERLLTVTTPAGARVPGTAELAALAEQLAQANWDQAERLCEGTDLSRAEIMALAMQVSPTAGLRLLDQYLDARQGN